MSHYHKTDNELVNNRKVINYDDLEEGELIEEDEIKNNDDIYSKSKYLIYLIFNIV